MPTGITTTFDLTVGVIVNMDEAIYLLSPDDTPLLTGMGADGLSVIGSSPVDEVVFSWMTDTLLTPRSALNGALTTGDTVMTLTTGDRTKFSTGDAVMIQKVGTVNEIIRITGYGTTAETLLITKGYEGTTSTTYASLSLVVAVGTALAEGSDPEAARTVDRVEVSNVTQIFGPTSVHMSATEQVVRKYGVANEFTHALMKRIKENAIEREQAYLYGRKTNSTTTKIRTTAGLKALITTRIDATSTQLTVATITSNQQAAYNNGGMPDRVMANPVALADLNDASNTSILWETIEDANRGRRRVGSVMTEFGETTIVRNRWMLPHDAVGFTREGVTRRILRPLAFEPLAKTGDARKAQIVCEEGLEVKNQGHCFWMNTLSYTGSN